MDQLLYNRFQTFSKWILIFWILDIIFLILFIMTPSYYFSVTPFISFFRQQLYFILQPLFWLALILRIPWVYYQYKDYKNPLAKDPYWLYK